MDVTLRKFDDVPPTHALVEKYLPAGEVWQARGYLFIAADIGAKLDEPDSTVTFGETTWPAWKLGANVHLGRGF